MVVTGFYDLTLQVIMEIPLELMLTVSQKLPWMFFPDIIPIGHPIFDIINSTNPEVMDFLSIRNKSMLVHLSPHLFIWRFSSLTQFVGLVVILLANCKR